MLTRRQLLKMGAIGGAAAVLPWERAVAALISEPSAAQFAVPMPVPPVLVPTSTDATTDYYRIEMRQAVAQVLPTPGVLTPVWAYNGLFPGPTIRARSNRRVVVTQVNRLGVSTSVHNHGAHTSPESDGFPTDYVHPGTEKVYVYPNSQIAAPLWYHDHVMHDTSRNVYMGLAAAYLLGDDVEDALNLPSGDYDIPCLIMDRLFNADGSFDFQDSHNNEIGDTFLVNGRTWPYFEVGTRKYRFRFINASNSREYELALDSGEDLIQIGSDGGLLARPFATPSIRISPAERVEVVIDFGGRPLGTQLVLKNLRGASATGTDVLMRFDVVRNEEDDSDLPTRLRTIEPIGRPGVIRDINMDFDFATGLWVINGKSFDPDRVDVRPKLNIPEIWRVSNTSGVSHPFHVHLTMFQILDRNGIPPGPGEAGWKDTVRVDANETVNLLMKFTGFTGRYVYHCHNLAHEDHDMMAQLEVVPATLDVPITTH